MPWLHDGKPLVSNSHVDPRLCSACVWTDDPLPPAEPDGYTIIHHGQNFTAYFGPFASLEEVRQWMQDEGLAKGVGGAVYPMYKTVDWSRSAR